jgi:hypothetical protein
VHIARLGVVAFQAAQDLRVRDVAPEAVEVEAGARRDPVDDLRALDVEPVAMTRVEEREVESGPGGGPPRPP